MSDKRARLKLCDLDSLRLMAIGRIPRCRNCSRYRGLVEAHAEPGIARALAAPPSHCTYQVCAPLAARLSPKRRRNPADVTHLAIPGGIPRANSG